MSRRGWLAFAAMSAIWGVPYLLIKVALDGGIGPAALAWLRVLLAAVVLTALALARRSLRSLRGRLRWVAAFAVVEIAIPFPLIAAGEERVPSSLAAIVIASVPLLIALLALWFDPAERPTSIQLAGLLVGFAGVVALVGVNGSSHPDELLGMFAILLAAAGYAVGPMILKHRLADLEPVATMAGAMTVAAVVLAPAAAANLPSARPGPGALAAILALAIVCTAAAFVLYNILIAEAGPARASVITYLNPLVAVILGVTLLGDRPGPGALVGLPLILAGSWVSTDGRGSARLLRALRRERV